MNRLLLVSVILLFNPSVYCAEINGVNFSDSLKVSEHTLVINGFGERLYGFFNTKIYAAALYLKKRESDPQKIIASKSEKSIEMEYIYKNISQDDMVNGWKVSFKDNCHDCRKIQTIINEFYVSVGEKKSGNRITYQFGPFGVKVIENGKTVFESTSQSFAKVLLSTWIGAKPATKKLKKALMGK